MIAKEQAGRRGFRLLVKLGLALIGSVLASAVAAQPLNGGTLACSDGADSGVAVGQQLLTQISTSSDPTKLDSLNSAWVSGGEPAIEGKTIFLDRVHIPQGCNPPGGENVTPFCASKLGFSHCQYTYVTMTLKPLGKPGDANYQPTISGLSPLRFTALTVPRVNERNVALHSNRGPDAGVITDGVFAPPGSSAVNTAYAVVLPHNGKQNAIVIKLGDTPVTVCGVKTGCNAPKIQADNDDDYHLDYWDGTQWKPVGTFSTPGSSGLQSRSLAGSGIPATFTTSYVAVYATGNGNTYAISELQLWGAADNKLVSVGKPAIGPVPYEIFDGIAPSNHSAGDSAVAVLLPHQPGIGSALMIDLGKTSSICGTAKDGCMHEPMIDADNDDIYMLDYSIDGVNWTTYGNYDPNTRVWHSATFSNVGGGDLQTRDMNCSARPDLTKGCGVTLNGDGNLPDGTINEGPNFTARYLRVYARSGGDHYSIAELLLWDTSVPAVRLKTVPTFTNPEQYGLGGYLPYVAGPEPYYTNGEFAEDGTGWDDGHYATKLGACAVGECPPGVPGVEPPISSAKQIDLTALFPISRLVIQAEGNNKYMVDGWDGTSLTASGTPVWKTLWRVPTGGGSGLRTRSTGFTAPLPQARYVRVYAYSGTNGQYSVSELQVFTPQANTGGTYANATTVQDPTTKALVLQPQVDSKNFPWSDGRANDGKGFSCSYDGNFNTTLGVAQADGTVKTLTALPIGFYVDSVYLNAHCDNGTSSGDYNIATATKRTCGMTLVPPVGYKGPFTDKFQAGQCANPSTTKILSYMNFDEEDNSAIQFDSKDNVSPDPKTSDLTCSGWDSLAAHIPDVLRGFIPIVAADVVKQAMNGILDYHHGQPLIPFPRKVVSKDPFQTVPLQCDPLLGGGGPPPGSENISGIGGKATQVGSGSDSATLRITGTFTVDETLSLDGATLSVDSLLQEANVGELIQGPNGSAVLPVGLEAQKSSKPNKGVYRTPPGVKPMISARLDAQGSTVSFEIDVQSATIAEPEACLTGGSASATLTTAFVLVGASINPIQLQGTSTWQCKGAQLATR